MRPIFLLLLFQIFIFAEEEKKDFSFSVEGKMTNYWYLNDNEYNIHTEPLFEIAVSGKFFPETLNLSLGYSLNLQSNYLYSGINYRGRGDKGPHGDTLDIYIKPFDYFGFGYSKFRRQSIVDSIDSYAYVYDKSNDGKNPEGYEDDPLMVLGEGDVFNSQSQEEKYYVTTYLPKHLVFNLVYVNGYDTYPKSSNGLYSKSKFSGLAGFEFGRYVDLEDFKKEHDFKIRKLQFYYYNMGATREVGDETVDWSKYGMIFNPYFKMDEFHYLSLELDLAFIDRITEMDKQTDFISQAMEEFYEEYGDPDDGSEYQDSIWKVTVSYTRRF